MIQLTSCRIRILESISSYITMHGTGPTIREIGVMAGLSSSSSVAYQLAQLEAGGLLVRGTRSWSSVELTGSARRRLAAAQSATATPTVTG